MRNKARNSGDMPRDDYPRWPRDGEEACRAPAVDSKIAMFKELAPFPEAEGTAFRSLGNPNAN